MRFIFAIVLFIFSLNGVAIATEIALKAESRKVPVGFVLNPEWGYTDFKTDYFESVDAVDRLALQNAINRVSSHGGGEVRLSAGNYIIDEKVILKSNVKLIGATDASGKRLTTLTSGRPNTRNIIRLDSVAKNIVVENIIFDSKTHDTVSIEGYFSDKENILIRNNEFLNVGIAKLENANLKPEIRSQNRRPVSAINFSNKNSKNVTIESNYFENIAVHPFGIKNGTNIIVNNNKMINGGSGMDISSNNHNVEVLNNDISNVLEGIKVVGNGGRNIYVHNNVIHDNPKASYWEPVTQTHQDGGGAGMFLQFPVDNLQIFDNYIDGDNMNIKKNAGGYEAASLKNNISSKGKIPDKDAGKIEASGLQKRSKGESNLALPSRNGVVIAAQASFNLSGIPSSSSEKKPTSINGNWDMPSISISGNNETPCTFGVEMAHPLSGTVASFCIGGNQMKKILAIPSAKKAAKDAKKAYDKTDKALEKKWIAEIGRRISKIVEISSDVHERMNRARKFTFIENLKVKEQNDALSKGVDEKVLHLQALANEILIDDLKSDLE